MPSKFGELLLRMPELQRVCQVLTSSHPHIFLPLVLVLVLLPLLLLPLLLLVQVFVCLVLIFFLALTLLQRSSGGKGDALPLPAASRGGGRRAWLQLPHGAAEGRPLGARHLLQDPQQQLFLRPLIEMNNATPSLRRFLTRLTSWELLLSFLNRSALSGFLTILQARRKRRLSNQIQYFLSKHPPRHHLVEFFNFKANHFWQILRNHIFPPNQCLSTTHHFDHFQIKVLTTWWMTKNHQPCSKLIKNGIRKDHSGVTAQETMICSTNPFPPL